MRKLSLVLSLVTISLSALSSQTKSLSSKYTFENHTLAKGEWISKLLMNREMNNEEILEMTLQKNGLTREQAKSLEIGRNVYLPVLKKQNTVVVKEREAVEEEILTDEDLKDDLEDIIKTEQAAVAKSDNEIEEIEAEVDDRSSINVALGAFAADDRFHQRNADITRQINTRVMVGTKINTESELVRSVNINGFGEFYDIGKYSNNESEDRLNSSFGLGAAMPINLTNELVISPEFLFSNYNSYDFDKDDELKQRSDNNGWVGLVLSYQMGEFTPYVKYSHLSSTDDNDSDFERLRGSMNKIGLDYTKGDFVAGLFWKYSDWNMETKDFTRDIGLNLGYNF